MPHYNLFYKQNRISYLFSILFALKKTFIVVLLFSLFSCQDDKIEMPDTGRKIVINGLLTSDSLFSVLITKSAYVIDTNYFVDTVESNDYRDGLNNVKVYVYQDNHCIDSLYHRDRVIDSYQHFYKFGNYTSKKNIPIPGKEYTIVAKYPGLPDVICKTVIPQTVKIEHLDTSSSTIVNEYNQTVGQINCHISFTDPINEKNYYLLNMSDKRPPEKWDETKDSIKEYSNFTCDDPIIEYRLGDQPIDKYVQGVVFSDKIINGKSYTLTIPINYSIYPSSMHEDTFYKFIYKKWTFYFRLYSITEDYYKYIQSFLLYTKGGKPSDRTCSGIFKYKRRIWDYWRGCCFM